MSFLSTTPSVVDSLPEFLMRDEIVNAMVNEKHLNKTDTEKYFDEGIQLYKDGKPRPPRPEGENGFEKPEDAAYYGWMMERIKRIDFIGHWIGHIYEKGSSEYEEQLSKSIKALDATYGLTKDDDFDDFPTNAGA